MGSGTECTLSKFVENTKLCDAFDTLEGRDDIQRDLDRLERWVCMNLRKFNNAKWKVLHVGQGNPKHRKEDLNVLVYNDSTIRPVKSVLCDVLSANSDPTPDQSWQDPAVS
ncbi:rna-directed dna polymerase from mobile element jockey-like [Pitangus sulphuratus]|nr:rna-directed dna polymerase from mobile element jockey-like [Pitangus sulphuratus]